MSIVFDRNDWTALVAFIAGVYIVLFRVAVDYKYVHNILRKYIILPPAWIYGPLWFVLYAIIIAAVFIFWKMGDAASSYYVATFALIIFNLAMNRMWTPVFFGTSFEWALAIAISMAVSGAAIIGLIGYQASIGSSLLWISFGFLLVYESVVVVSVVINIQAIRYVNENKPDKARIARARSPWDKIMYVDARVVKIEAIALKSARAIIEPTEIKKAEAVSQLKMQFDDYNVKYATAPINNKHI